MANTKAKSDPFRTTVVIAMLAFSIVVVHDIYAKWHYEWTFESACDTHYRIETYFWKRGDRDTQPTHSEIEIEYRARNKPKTWLF